MYITIYVLFNLHWTKDDRKKLFYCNLRNSIQYTFMYNKLNKINWFKDQKLNAHF